MLARFAVPKHELGNSVAGKGTGANRVELRLNPILQAPTGGSGTDRHPYPGLSPWATTETPTSRAENRPRPPRAKGPKSMPLTNPRPGTLSSSPTPPHPHTPTLYRPRTPPRSATDEHQMRSRYPPRHRLLGLQLKPSHRDSTLVWGREPQRLRSLVQLDADRFGSPP